MFFFLPLMLLVHLKVCGVSLPALEKSPLCLEPFRSLHIHTGAARSKRYESIKTTFLHGLNRFGALL